MLVITSCVELFIIIGIVLYSIKGTLSSTGNMLIKTALNFPFSEDLIALELTRNVVLQHCSAEEVRGGETFIGEGKERD